MGLLGVFDAAAGSLFPPPPAPNPATGRKEAMTDAAYSLADLAAEEEELQFSAFTHDHAWELGSALVAAGREQHLPIAIDITRNRHQLFHAAHAGAFPVLVRDVGPIGVVVVSGLPQVQDHRMVVAALRAHLAA